MSRSVSVMSEVVRVTSTLVAHSTGKTRDFNTRNSADHEKCKLHGTDHNTIANQDHSRAHVLKREVPSIGV